MWTPDAYQGAPTPVAAFFSVGPKAAAFAVIMSAFVVAFPGSVEQWGLLFIVLAIATMLAGNLYALVQNNVKRMLAYSSIAQSGYILMALAVGTKTALAGGMLHVLTHAFMKGGAFVVVAAVAYLLSSEKIEDYKGLARRAPFLAFCMAIFLLSLAGIPPLAGFWSKFVLFAGAVEAGGWMVWLALAGVLNSAVSLYYYARVIKYMYVEEPPDGAPALAREPGPYVAAIFFALLAVVLIGLYPQPFIDIAMKAAGLLVH
jgi:NADH-quinone oxidoreductase subunit N